VLLRVGIGWDVHPFDPGRLLVLGGVKVEGAWGLKGHSDADVVLHAIADAMLGAAALGDLGDHFPDADPRWKDVPSALIVAEVVSKVRARGWKPSQVDVTVIAERPKLAPHRAAIRERVAALLEIDLGATSVKATTNNGIGELAKGAGMGALAVVVLVAADAEAPA
jgi:2-C-methyl-D-erythritol 2,4-cyclodiphosphate synthase